MEDNTNVTETTKDAVKGDVTKTTTEKVDVTIPKTRFDEVNNKYKEAKAKLEELEQARQAEELKQKEKQGEFESLYSQTKKEAEKIKADFEGTKSRAEQLEAVINSMLAEKLNAIPDEMKDLVPEGLAPEAKLKWVSQAEAKGLFKKKSEEPLGGSTNPNSKATVDTSKLDSMSLLKMGYSK